MTAFSVNVEQMRAVLSGPPEAAVCWLREAATRGSCEAQTVLGQHLLEGVGVAANEAEAVFWFRRGARADYPMAFNMLGRCYELGRGVPADALVSSYWFRLAAEAGLDWGMYNYATALTLGRGIGADRRRAFEWYRRAADLGHAKSLNIVGGFYEDGWEVPQDLARAFDCYARAASAGDFRGQFNYGRLLADRAQLSEAVTWLHRGITVGTPAFAEKALRFLRGSPHTSLRHFAASFGCANAAKGLNAQADSADPRPQ